MTLAVEDKNQKLFDVLAFAVVDNEQIVDEVLVTASFGNSWGWDIYLQVIVWIVWIVKLITE